MTTPREQLIDAIADKRCRMASINPGGLPGQYEGARPKFTESADLTLQVLSDLGAVVLMPVNKADVPDSTGLVYELHETLGGHVQSLWPVSFNGARHDTVYVMALKGGQS